MRLFIVIDGRSQVSAARVWDTLNTHCKREEFEVLPLAPSVFESVGTSYGALKLKAEQEAARVFNHYIDASCCVVVYCEQCNTGNSKVKPLYLDRAIVYYRSKRKKSVEIILNERMVLDDDKPMLISSPKLQPVITSALVEYALFDVMHKY